MTTKSSSPSTVLLIILVVITFPFWIGLMGAMIGIIGGMFGAVFGMMGGILGGLAHVITWPLKMLFGHHWGWWPHFHFNGFVVISLIVLAVLMTRKRK